MGVDIKPGYSPGSKRAARYCVTILRDGKVVASYDDVPLYRIVRLIIEHHVDVVAVDNVYELVEGAKSLYRLAKIIPSWCNIVEVTWTPNGYRDVASLAREHGLPIPSDPQSTSLVNALLAERGLGREVKLHCDRTYIIVSKGRTPSQGGSSSDRFKRSVRASVLAAVREIKGVLDANKLDYDLVVKRSKGGLERGFFVVYAPYEKVRELISPLKHKNIKIKVETAPDMPLRESPRRVILGIDPGMSVGVAILDLAGTPLLVKSFKTPDRELILRTILSIGRPLLVAVDVAKPPELVEKIASMLDAILYTPEQDLSVEEKNSLTSRYVERYNVELEDSHARDALAAAIKAYGHIKPVIDEVASKIRGIPGVSLEDAVSRVLRGMPLSMALEELFKRELGEKEPEQAIIERPSERKALEPNEELKVRVRELEQTVKRLEEELAKRDREIQNLILELKLAKRAQPREEYERAIERLKLELEALRKALEEKSRRVEELERRALILEEVLLGVGRGDYVVVCKSSRIESCRGELVYLDDPTRLELAVNYAKTHKSGIVVTSLREGVDWRSLRVPVVVSTPILELRDHVILPSSVKEEVKALWRMIEELEERERRERIIRLIREYQESRRKMGLE
jgi:predicted RNase H-like nuclease (RuvC/YqgF family)